MKTLNERISKLLTISCSVSCAGTIVAEKPNLVIIMTDEHNLRTLGCYRNQMNDSEAYVWGRGNIVETPNIDYIAKNGVICTSMYAVFPQSSPSRSSFFTGMYPAQTGVLENNLPMKDAMVTFAQTLTKNGYKTGYAGKWHLDGEQKPGWAPVRRFGFEDNRYMFNRGHWKNLKENERGPFIGVVNSKGEPIEDYSLGDADEKSYTTDFLTNRAIDFIQDNKNKSFCYVLSFPDPHGPNTVRSPYDMMYRHMKFEHPKSAKVEKEQGRKKEKTIIDNKNQMANYFGMVKCIDDNIGKIIKTLKDEGLWDNTIIVFTADHGDMLGEHGLDNKGTPWDMSSRIPFIVYYKGVLKSGTVVDVAMNNVDFTPTILSLMNIKSDIVYEGRNYATALKTNKIPEKEIDAAVFYGRTHWIAAANKDYKLVLYTRGTPELYSLKNDPQEMVNLYGQKEYQDVVKKLSTVIYQNGIKYNNQIFENSSFVTALRKLKK